MKDYKNRLRSSTGTTGLPAILPLECTLFEDLKNKRIFTLIHWSEWTGTQILEHNFNPAVLRKHMRLFQEKLGKGDNNLIKHIFAIIPFEVPRYYFQ